MAPIWDHLFGGWSECRDRNVVVGVDTPYRQGFLGHARPAARLLGFLEGPGGRRTLSPSEMSPSEQITNS